jgi:predicted 2-oxoglutarate/Fe(II)-dependent dioxygenase YbiX
MEISSYISCIRNAIPAEFCENIINKYKNAEWRNHTWQTNYGNAQLTYGNNELDVYNITEQDVNIEFWKYIQNALNFYQAERNITAFVTKVSEIRLNRYNTNTCMRTHVDHIYDLFDGEKRGIPVLSIIINLNENYEGGELTFFDNEEIKLTQGDIVIFPSNFMYPHGVNLITNNIRYSAVAWAY